MCCKIRHGGKRRERRGIREIVEDESLVYACGDVHDESVIPSRNAVEAVKQKI